MGKVTNAFLKVPCLPGEYESWKEHEERVVEHQAVLPQLLRLQLLLHEDTVTGGEEVIQQHVGVARVRVDRLY